MSLSRFDFDVDFDFHEDTPPSANADPDGDSPTLRRYHRMLWSKPLKSGEAFTLEAPEVRSHGYLVYNVPGGDKMWLRGDCITHSYRDWNRPKVLVQAKAALTSEQQNRYFNQAYTVGSAMLGPVKMGPPMTINRAPGWKWSSIGDRMDLTLECIRRYYEGRTDSPLAENLAHNSEFFALFDGFREFIPFFLLQDLVAADSEDVRFFLPCEDFGRPATPQNVDEYVTYREAQLAFIGQRQHRMSDWVSTHKPYVT